MSSDATDAALAAVLDALTLVQGQLDTIARGHARIEAVQKDMLARLDTIDAGQVAVTELVPVLEMILARSIEDRELTRTQLAVVAAVAGFAHAAASGSAASLPVEVADDPLLERFAMVQPPDRTSKDRALVDWRRATSAAGTAELVGILASQYRPSPSDTAQTRVLRYRLAAITRSEIEGRVVVPPPPPLTIFSQGSTLQERLTKSEQLAHLWRAGESAALYAEPELAGALDLFAEAERQAERRSGKQLSAELAHLHRDLGDRVAAGERPGVGAKHPEIADGGPVQMRPEVER